jgi:serine-type D-Ala-D-Ala carboxypeptidase (penicillin-binding protein 5/6)
MVRLLAALAASATLLAAGTDPALADPALAEPSINIQPAGSIPIPDGPSPSWIIADLDSGQVLAGRDMYGAYPPASTIKTLLALTVLDELGPETTVVASPAAANVICNCAGVEAGRAYTVRQLLDATLLVSGNDAANVLADAIGGFDVAVDKMNAKAARVGATNTHATSPSGLDGPGGPGWTTPHDLAVIFRAAMANPLFAAITALPAAPFPAAGGERILVNQDELLQRYPGTLGGKTGYTYAARKTFVAAAQRNNRRLVIAMLFGTVREGGPTYWDQAATLLDWGFAQNPAASVAML